MNEQLAAVAPLARSELARRHLADFLALLQPAYEQPAHVRLLCNHLETLEAHEIRRLIVQMPPRHGKTLHTSMALPAWFLGRHPNESVILASYAAELAEANSRRARGFLLDPRYPFETKVSAESSAVNRWNSTAGGGVIASGIGGGLTGHGANLAVIDDPVKDREAADSEAIRESTWRWFVEVLLTRLQPSAAVLLCQTRWHEDDLAGRILSSSGAKDWTVLSLPALAEEDDPLGRAEGAPLWPEWFDLDFLSDQRETLGSRAFSALYQQSPTPDKGGVFQRDWFAGRYSALPEELTIVQAIDSAFKTGVANDFSVISTWASDKSRFYLVNVWRRKAEYPDLIRAIKAQAEEHRPQKILIEDTGPGQSAIQTLKRETNLPAVPVPAKGSKVSRAEAVSPLFEAGKVLLPAQSPPWLDPWIEEHIAFPGGKHDDQIDATGFALEFLRGSTRGRMGSALVIHHVKDPRVKPGGATHLEPGWKISEAEARRKNPGWKDPRYD